MPYIQEARQVNNSHGEQWLACPHCGNTFEFWDAQYEKHGITKTAMKNVFVCPKCRHPFKII